MRESSTSRSGEEHDDELRSLEPADGETQGNTDTHANPAGSEEPELEGLRELPELQGARDGAPPLLHAPETAPPSHLASHGLEEQLDEQQEQVESAAAAAPPAPGPDQPLAEDVLADDMLADDVPADDVPADDVPADDVPADDAVQQSQSHLPETSAEGDGEHLSEPTSDVELAGSSEPAPASFEPATNAPLPEPEMTELVPHPADGAISDEGEAGVPTESVVGPIAQPEGGLSTGPQMGPLAEPSTLVAHSPWTLRQTIVGTVLTLGPWLIFALGTQLAARGSPAPTPAHRLAPSIDLVQAIVLFVVSSVLEAIFLIAPLYFAIHTLPPGITGRARWPAALRALGLRLPNPVLAARAAVAAIVVILGASVAYTSIVNTLHLPLKTNVDTLMQQAKYEPYTVVGTLLVAVLVAPFCEEMFFRGYLFPGLARGMQLWVAVLVSAALFGLAHADLGSFVVLFVIGIVLAVVRARTDSLWPGITVHTLNNTIAFISILVLLR